jgi:ABC-type lipoprotein release transport system permease subunit
VGRAHPGEDAAVNAVRLRLRVEARAHWRSWLGAALLVGILTGAGIAAFSGARRTQTAYARFLRGTRAFDIALTNGSTPESINRQFDFDEIARLPEVGSAAKIAYYNAEGSTPTGRQIVEADLAPFASIDGRFGAALNRVRVLHGRLPTGADEIALSFLCADRLGVRAGDRLRLSLAGPKASAAGDAELRPIRVVGIVAIQGGFPPITGGLPPLALLSSTYARTHPDSYRVLAVRLRDGTRDVPAFNRELDRRSPRAPVVTSNQLEIGAPVQRGLDVQATALRLLGLVVAALTILLLGQALARLETLEADDDGVLRGLGFTSTQLRARASGRGVAIGIVAAAVATITAALLSTLTPVGVARQAELHPGIAVNVAYLGVGLAGVLLFVVLLSVIPAFWTSSARRHRRMSARVTAGSRVGGALASAGASTAAEAGVRMALEPGRGRTSVPVRSTIVSAIVGVAVIAGVLGFSASLGRLLREPHLYGWNWDIQVGDLFAPDLRPEATRLAQRPETDAVAVATIARLRSGSVLFDTLAIDPLKGTTTPTVVEGRAPVSPTEIMVGTRTLDDLRLGVGDTVPVSVGNRSARLRIVGRGVLPEFAGAARLGEGAAMTYAGAHRLVGREAVADVVLVRVRAGPAGAGLVRDLSHTRLGNVYLPAKPSDLVDLGRIGGLPSVIAALLAVMAIATLAHALFSAARRRRRELAILKVLGFRRRQVSAAIAWQATVVAAIAIVVGIPLGVAGGRWGWQAFAQRLGVPDQPVTPVAAMIAVAALALVVAFVTAAIPARVAARTRPAVALRAE